MIPFSSTGYEGSQFEIYVSLQQTQERSLWRVFRRAVVRVNKKKDTYISKITTLCSLEYFSKRSPDIVANLLCLL